MVKNGKDSGYESVQLWCAVNGWSDLFKQEGIFHAFPPGAVLTFPVIFLREKSYLNFVLWKPHKLVADSQ